MFSDDLCGLDVVAAIDGAAARVVINGELDLTSAPRLISTIHDLVRLPVRSIDLDCEGIAFLDSAGVRALIVGRNEATRMGVHLALVEPSAAVSRVLDMTGLASILT